MRTTLITTAILLSTQTHAQTLIVLNKAEASVSLLNPHTGETDALIPVGDGPHEAEVSPDGNTVVVCNYGQRTHGNTLSVINLESKSVTRTIDLGNNQRPHGIVFSADGQRIYVTTERSQKLLIVNIETGEIEQAIDTKAQGSHMVAVTPDETRAFTTNLGSGSVTAIDLTTNSFIKELKTDQEAEGVATHPTRPELWVSNRAGNSVSVVDTNTLEVVETFDCPLFPIRLEITPDGSTAIVSNARSGDITFFDVNTRTKLGNLSMNAAAKDDADQRLFSDQFGDSPVPVGIQITPDSTTAYVANTNADVITVVDIDTRSITGRLTAGKEPDGMAWSPLPPR
ncbi:MAG: YVTN family beta-propeller repeat protein [Planctomycetota bacterium]|jgi:YVTN family beta-propeller protein